MTESVVDQEPLDGTAMLAALGVEDEPALTPLDPGSGLDEFVSDTTTNPVQAPTAVVAPPEFECQRSVLAAMVEQVMLAVPSKDFFPALRSIVIDVTDSSLTLTGSNSASTVVSTSLAVRTARPGRVLVPGGKFAAVVRLTAGPAVSVSVRSGAVHVVSGTRSWTLRASGTQDYPPLPELGDLSWVEVSRAAFDRVVAGTRYAAGVDESRDHYMQLDLSGGTAVACDGLRFAQADVDLPPELSVQMATSGVDLITKILANNDADQFRVAESPYHTVVEVGPPEAPDRAVVAHLMRPLPPEARSAISGPRAANRDRCVVVAADLLAALSAARPTQDSESGAVLLRVSAEEIRVESRNRYGDSSSEAIGCVFSTPGSERAPKPRVVTLVRDHLAKAVRAVQRAATGVSDPDDEEDPGSEVEVTVLLGEDRSRSRPAAVLVQDYSGSVQAVLSQVRSEWLTP